MLLRFTAAVQARTLANHARLQKAWPCHAMPCHLLTAWMQPVESMPTCSRMLIEDCSTSVSQPTSPSELRMRSRAANLPKGLAVGPEQVQIAQHDRWQRGPGWHGLRSCISASAGRLHMVCSLPVLLDPRQASAEGKAGLLLCHRVAGCQALGWGEICSAVEGLQGHLGLARRCCLLQKLQVSSMAC